MNHKVRIKRNTTPTLEIRVHFNLDNVKELEFMFKLEPDEDAKELLHVELKRGEMEIAEQTGDYFVVKVELSAADTMKLPAGDVYMDTRVVTLNNKTPKTPIVVLGIDKTLFPEVRSND